MPDRHTAPPAPTVTSMTEDDFYDAFKPIPGKDGSEWRDHTDIPESVKDEYIWTVVDGDDAQYVIPGVHRVNRVALIVCAEPWTDLNVEVLVEGFEDEDEEPDGAPCCPAPGDHDTKDGTCDFPGYAANH